MRLWLKRGVIKVMGMAKESLPDMHMLRREIDCVDSELLDLIAKRMELAGQVRKAKSGINVWRPSREESHVRDLAKKAGNTPPELVSHIWAELTSASLTLQGPIRLHVALASDALSQWTLVRDRFGASIPVSKYPTASAALASAQADPEGVAILHAPGGMNNWWTALGTGRATSNMKIHAALPRIGNWDWPEAVAVSKAPLEPSGDDMSLLMLRMQEYGHADIEGIFANLGLIAMKRAEVGEFSLYSLPIYLHANSPEYLNLQRQIKDLDIVGVLPAPIKLPTVKTDDEN